MKRKKRIKPRDVILEYLEKYRKKENLTEQDLWNELKSPPLSQSERMLKQILEIYERVDKKLNENPRI